MAAPSFSSRAVTNGYFKVPNSFAENQAALIPAERALALIFFRRAGDFNGSTTVSDRVWQSWTGLAPRQKEYALAGLKHKGMKVDGRGDLAKLTWSFGDWQSYLRAVPSKVEKFDPKRVERDQKAAEMHEECAEHGCAMLRNGNCPDVKESKTALFLPTITHQGAQTVEKAVEEAWLLTMAKLRSFFPLIAMPFLMLLLVAVRKTFADVTDIELARAVEISFKPGQETEGLFLQTVPEAVAALRRGTPIDEKTGSPLPVTRVAHQGAQTRKKKPRAIDLI